MRGGGARKKTQVARCERGVAALRCASVCVSLRCVSVRLPVERRGDDQRRGQGTFIARDSDWLPRNRSAPTTPLGTPTAAAIKPLDQRTRNLACTQTSKWNSGLFSVRGKGPLRAARRCLPVERRGDDQRRGQGTSIARDFNWLPRNRNVLTTTHFRKKELEGRSSASSVTAMLPRLPLLFPKGLSGHPLTKVGVRA